MLVGTGEKPKHIHKFRFITIQVQVKYMEILKVYKGWKCMG